MGDTTSPKNPQTAHLPWGEMSVDERLYEVRFPRGSTTANCRGALMFDERPELKTPGCCVPEGEGSRDIGAVCCYELGLVCGRRTE